MINTVRVQEKGQVTIPRIIRRQLNLKKGDLVTFITTDNGVIIKTLDLAAEDILESLRNIFLARGIRLEAILERSQKVGSDTLVREFGLSSDERSLLYQALQLKAQSALESIRSVAETTGSSELAEEEIEDEVREARNESPDAHRS
jgi:AbrB family looped-hinge helix DNA binding protein